MERMTTTTQKRIILWSTPRSLSSAMCRVMMNSGYSTQIVFEPYAAAYHLGPERICTRYKVTDPDPSFTFKNALKSLQMPYSDKELVFTKILPFHMKPSYFSPEWIPDGYMHTFITRHPRKVALSLSNVVDRDTQEQYDYGFRAQVCVSRLLQKLGHRVVVLDADDVMNNPEGMLRVYCREVGLEFCDSMINWKPMSQEEAESVFQTSRWESEWLDNVITSPRLQGHQNKSSKCDDDDDTMDPRKRDLIEKCVQENMKYYEVMSGLCLKV